MTKRDPESPSGDESEPAPGSPLPAMDLSTFILSLATQGLIQMGMVADPATGSPGAPDPLMARQTIDTLEMLRAKTRGNLEDEEEKLFDSLLYELHMRFVEVDG